MPITITSLGPNVDVNIVDANFQEIQDLFRSGLLRDDFSGSPKFSRFRLFRYTSGMIRSASSRSFPLRDASNGVTSNVYDTFDLAYRSSGEDASVHASAKARVDEEHRNAYAMEMLGRPGPSFYYTWQEDGLNEPSTYGATGWPPSNWPPNRYPQNFCFSRWLTVPGASLRVYVPEKAVASVYGLAKGCLNLWARIDIAEMRNRFNQLWTEREHQTRNSYAFRFGLIVDTNPDLYQDEFQNSNPNIDGSYRSWDIIEDQTFAFAPRDIAALRSKVALRGGRWYNFRMAYRDAAHHGFVDRSGPVVWNPGIWEDNVNSAITNSPTSATWPIGAGPSPAIPHPFFPAWVSLFENAHLGIVLDYGRENAGPVSADDSDFAIGAI